MKRTYTISLTLALAAVWLLWSGHFEPFMLFLGGLSVAFCVWMSWRMGVVDEEGTPAQLGFRPFTQFAPWLLKEIVVSNIAVAKIVLSPKPALKRNLVEVTANQKSEIGRVILANAITLTPGTVSVRLQHDKILVHALSFEGAEEDLSGEMDRRVKSLENCPE